MAGIPTSFEYHGPRADGMEMGFLLRTSNPYLLRDLLRRRGILAEQIAPATYLLSVPVCHGEWTWKMLENFSRHPS